MNFHKLQQEIVRIVDSLDESAVPMKPYAQTYARHIVQAALEAESYGDTPMKACKTQLLYVVSNLEGAPEITLRRIQRVAGKHGIDIVNAVDEVLRGFEEDEGPGENPPPFPVVTAEEEVQRRQSDRIHEAIDAVMSDPKNAGAFELHVAQTLARISDRLSMPGVERMLARHLARRRPRPENSHVYELRLELHSIANMMGADEIEMLFDDAFTMQARLETGHPVHRARANPPRSRIVRDVNLRRCPLLRSAVVAGRVWVDGDVYVGRAGDGHEVQLGNIGREGDVERYLSEHPKPEDW